MTSNLLPPAENQWLVFTDMDGSLLDHYTYQFDEAVPALTALKQRQIPVIPITSKTQAELEWHRQALDNNHPFVAENGAAVYIPTGYFDHQPAGTVAVGGYWVKEFVANRGRWQSLIEKLKPDYPDQFVTFADAGTDGIVSMTGLSLEQAERASRRQYGEPLSWLGTTELKKQFIKELATQGATILEGGRFMHVSGATDKGLALTWLTQAYQNNQPHRKTATIALGDSNNDKAMLETADFAVLIRSPAHSLPPINRENNLFVTNRTGPQGWTEGVNNFIDLTATKSRSKI